MLIFSIFAQIFDLHFYLREVNAYLNLYGPCGNRKCGNLAGLGSRWPRILNWGICYDLGPTHILWKGGCLDDEEAVHGTGLKSRMPRKSKLLLYRLGWPSVELFCLDEDVFELILLFGISKPITA